MKLFLFDCDGTLIDSQGTIVRAMEIGFKAVGLEPPTPSQTRSIIGISLDLAIPQLLGQTQITDQSQAIADAYRKAFFELRTTGQAEQPLYEGIGDLIFQLGNIDDVILGIATGKSRRGLNHIIEREGWERYFHTTQTGDDAPSKPHPGMIYNALSDTGADASNTVMIGDTTYDLDMGKAAKARTIGVTWGYHPVEQLQSANPTHIVSSVAELKSLLLNWQSD